MTAWQNQIKINIYNINIHKYSIQVCLFLLEMTRITFF